MTTGDFFIRVASCLEGKFITVETSSSLGSAIRDSRTNIHPGLQK